MPLTVLAKLGAYPQHQLPLLPIKSSPLPLVQAPPLAVVEPSFIASVCIQDYLIPQTIFKLANLGLHVKQVAYGQLSNLPKDGVVMLYHETR